MHVNIALVQREVGPTPIRKQTIAFSSIIPRAAIVHTIPDLEENIHDQLLS